MNGFTKFVNPFCLFRNSIIFIYELKCCFLKRMKVTLTNDQ